MICNSELNLPDGFSLKTLNVCHLGKIYHFLNTNYIKNEAEEFKTIFHKDYLYWYLKYVPPGFIIGLLNKNRLVGFVTVTFIDMIIYDTKVKIPYINLLCVHLKLRKLGLANILLNKIKHMLSEINLPYAFYTKSASEFKKNCASSVITSKLFVIPLNHSKLKSIGFSSEDFQSIQISVTAKTNPFHLMVLADLDSVIIKLNKFMTKFDIHIWLEIESAKHFLIPKKNIVYSFVKKNSDGIITDFISAIVTCTYFTSTDKKIYTANITYYFYETMSLTEMVSFTMLKLPSYGIDQICLNEMAHNKKINITKFECDTGLQNHFDNLNIPEMHPKQILLGV